MKKNQITKRITGIMAVLVLTGFLTGCGGKDGDNPGGGTPPPTVTLTGLKMDNLELAKGTTGTPVITFITSDGVSTTTKKAEIKCTSANSNIVQVVNEATCEVLANAITPDTDGDGKMNGPVITITSGNLSVNAVVGVCVKITTNKPWFLNDGNHEIFPTQKNCQYTHNEDSLTGPLVGSNITMTRTVDTTKITGQFKDSDHFEGTFTFPSGRTARYNMSTVR